MALSIPTKYWEVNAENPEPEVIRQAGLILRHGGLVAFPTETVYGLGANALDEGAVEKIFRAKGRPGDNPLIIHVAELDAVMELAREVPGPAGDLMNKFWPGPLTIILNGKGLAAPRVSAGLNTLAFRMPDHPVALALIRESGVPVAAPSANLSGRPSPTTAGHVRTDLEGRIDVILDAGPAGLGVESTVLDLTGAVPVVLRPGGITPEQVKEVTGGVMVDPSLEPGGEPVEKPRSPGMKYRHYAPAAPLVLVEGRPHKIPEQIRELLAGFLQRGVRVGVICREENKKLYPGAAVIAAGTGADPGSVAAALYGALRRMDELGVEVILAEGVEPRGMGLAVANRLRRAAEKIINLI